MSIVRVLTNPALTIVNRLAAFCDFWTSARTDGAVDRDAFGFHEQIIRRFRPAEFAKAGALAGRWLMPMGTRYVVHRKVLFRILR